MSHKKGSPIDLKGQTPRSNYCLKAKLPDTRASQIKSVFSTFLLCFCTELLKVLQTSLLETFWQSKKTYELSRWYNEILPGKLAPKYVQ